MNDVNAFMRIGESAANHTPTLVSRLQSILDSHHAKTGFVSVPIEEAITAIEQRDALVAALRVGREVLAAVTGDIEDGFGLADLRAKYVATLVGARDGMDAALKAAQVQP